ncbi:uncharacterized protein ACNLHF_017559 [Anomaloglossus baeobatrachus]|uniref:uncharacterized protein LOC142302935 n=1 Tax=Anomaloglossus baeobatrachus TaxID=238106 RepID=UPI003F4FCD60
MKRFHAPALLLLLLGCFALGFTEDFDEDEDFDYDEESNDEENTDISLLDAIRLLIPFLNMSKKPNKENGGNPKKETGGNPKKETGGNPKKETGGNPKKENGGNPKKENGGNPKKENGGNPKKECDEKKPNKCEEERRPVADLPMPRSTSGSVTQPWSSAPPASRMTWRTTPEQSASTPPMSRPAMRTSAELPSPAPLSSRTAIFVPLAILLFLLVLLVAFLLWRYSHYFQCWRRLGGKDEATVKPENNEVTIQPPDSDPQGSEDQAQLPPSGHVYQEISDIRPGVPGPDSSYSTVGLPFHDQKTADQQPPDGQYSLLELSNQ